MKRGKKTRCRVTQSPCNLLEVRRGRRTSRLDAKLEKKAQGDPLRMLLAKMICGLRRQAIRKVPQHGKFDVVYEREEVKDLHIGLSHLILKVTCVGVKGSEDKRYLELGAVNYPSPYGAESVMGYGTTQEIIARLQDDSLLGDLARKTHDLAEDILYEERHPWG